MHPLANCTTEQIIEAAVAKFGAARPVSTVFAGGRAIKVHQAGERVLHLPNGAVVKVVTDDSGVVTQIEEDEAMHAVVRPNTLMLRLRQGA